jgi:hypothetical protein
MGLGINLPHIREAHLLLRRELDRYFVCNRACYFGLQ